MSVKINLLKPDHRYIFEAIDHIDAANRALGQLFSLQGEEVVIKSQAMEILAEAGEKLRTLEYRLEKRMADEKI